MFFLEILNVLEKYTYTRELVFRESEEGSIYWRLWEG